MRYYILDVPVDAVTIKEAAERAEEMLLGNKPNKIFTPNPEILLKASRDERYCAILNTADLALPDGIGVVLAGRLLGMPFRERVAGADFMLKLCELAAGLGKKVFLLGGRNGAAERAAAVLKKQFPGLQMAGWSEDADIPRLSLCKHRLSLGIDIVFVALGAGKQEKWICDNLPNLPNIKIAMAVGGAFDMIAGDIPRAPRFLREAGLEWLWRFLMEPGRRAGRIFNAVVIFPIKVIKSRIMNYES